MLVRALETSTLSEDDEHCVLLVWVNMYCLPLCVMDESLNQQGGLNVRVEASFEPESYHSHSSLELGSLWPIYSSKSWLEGYAIVH